VYTPGVTLDNRINYKPKNIKKGEIQAGFIQKALDQCFVFTALEDTSKEVLTNAMTQGIYIYNMYLYKYIYKYIYTLLYIYTHVQ
jgi:hypothetical protein